MAKQLIVEYCYLAPPSMVLL